MCQFRYTSVTVNLFYDRLIEQTRNIVNNHASQFATSSRKSGVNERRFYRDLIRVADARFAAHLKDWSTQDGVRT